ncbi:MAG: acyl carrier protein [Clostridia bacterium]|nr:acyl carrier protein [Clostridia bacterium]
MKMEIFEKLRDMIADQLALNKDDIKPESNIIKDLHADSLDLVETLMNIENEWGITIADDDVADIETIQDVVDLINAKL